MCTVYRTALLAVGILAASPSTSFAFNKGDAVRGCERYVQRSYGYRNIHDTTTLRSGRGSFEVRGRAKVPGHTDPYFTCIVVHGEVVSLRINKSSKTSEAIGKGIAGAVLIAAAAALDKKLHHAKPHPRYQGGNPFVDRKFLRQACKHEIMRNLSFGHARPKGMRVVNFNVHGRVADGNGNVRWGHGGRSSIHFTCHFDRRGRIHNGRYRYN